MIKSNPKTSWNSVESTPKIADTAYIDESATVIGDVRIGERVYVAPAVSLRADEATPIIIGDECNAQDGVIFHGLKGSSIKLGRRVSVAHGAVVHGPMKIADDSFVGFNAVVHACDLGTRCFVGHGALVIGVNLKPGSFVPPGSVIDTQEKGDALGPVPDDLKGFNEEVVGVNVEFARIYLAKEKNR